MNARELLGEYFCQTWNVDPLFECFIKYVDPESLLVPERMDVITKILWLEAYINDVGSKKYAD